MKLFYNLFNNFMADHKKTFFGKISHEEKLQYLIDLTKL